MHTHVAVRAAHSTSKHCTTHTVFGPTWKRTSEILTNRGACFKWAVSDNKLFVPYTRGSQGRRRHTEREGWRNQRYTFLGIFQGCGSLRQLAVRPRECRLGIALSPWHAQPSPFRDPNNHKIARRICEQTSIYAGWIDLWRVLIARFPMYLWRNFLITDR